MQLQSENIKRITKPKHDAPAGYSYPIFMKRGYLLVFFINKSNQFLVLDPAAKMNNGEKKKEGPFVDQQAGQHNNNKYYRRQGPCPECLHIKCHALVLLFLQKRKMAPSLVQIFS